MAATTKDCCVHVGALLCPHYLLLYGVATVRGIDASFKLAPKEGSSGPGARVQQLVIRLFSLKLGQQILGCRLG